MKLFLGYLSLFFSVSTFAQNIDINWQAYINTGADSVRASFYLAGPEFDLNTAFNDRNYPIWYLENQSIDVNGGVCSTTLQGISIDSLVKYQNRIFLYVTINGQPYERATVQFVPYSAYSHISRFSDSATSAMNSVYSRHSDTSKYASRASITDSAFVAAYAIKSNYSQHSDSADNSRTSVYADTAQYSVMSVRSSLSDNSKFSIFADSAKLAGYTTNALNATNSINAINAKTADVANTATFALSIADNAVSSPTILNGSIQRVDLGSGVVDETALSHNSVTSSKIVDGSVNISDVNIVGNGSNVSVLGYSNGSFQWVSYNNLYLNSIQSTTVIPTQINQDTRWLILKVAQDFNLNSVTATEGRVITIVNASTANFVNLTMPLWNIFGGTLVIGPRSSRTLAYLNNEWIVIQ